MPTLTDSKCKLGANPSLSLGQWGQSLFASLSPQLTKLAAKRAVKRLLQHEGPSLNMKIRVLGRELRIGDGRRLNSFSLSKKGNGLLWAQCRATLPCRSEKDDVNSAGVSSFK